MIEKIDKDSIIEKLKYIMQSLNLKWDIIHKSNAVTILSLGAIGGLVLMSKFSILFVVAVLGIQRNLYYGNYFSDEDITDDVPDENITDKR